MEICFVLPRYVLHPIGGYKIVFEYANRLSQNRNYKVKILFLNKTALADKKLPVFIKNKLINLFTKCGPNWFKLDKKIERISLTQNNGLKKIKDVDKVVATAATTVKSVYELFPNADKYYLIQDFENWDISTKELYQTYNYPGFVNITVSKWLKDVVKKHSINPTYYVQNPLNVEEYRVKNPIEKRPKHMIGMLYHKASYKGTKYSLSAIKILKKKYPDLKVKMFGAYARPTNLPKWIEYTQNASKEETIDIYNSISVFINGSVKEGFGLTGLEAMACGATLVSTDYLGVKEYAINNKNALLSPVKDVNALVKNASILLQDDKKRITLAYKGVEMAQKYSWKNAYSRMIKILSLNK